jgi:hypothetical protein
LTWSCYFCGALFDFGVPMIPVYGRPEVLRIPDDAEMIGPCEPKVACPRCDPEAPVIVLTDADRWRMKMENLEAETD